MEEILLILCLTLNICFSFKPSDVLTLQEYNAWMHGNVTPELSEIDVYDDSRMMYESTELMIPEPPPLADIHRRVPECRVRTEDQTYMVATCRTCAVHLKPKISDGVILVCRSCQHQQPDDTCKLGERNIYLDVYRVAAKVFQVHYYSPPKPAVPKIEADVDDTDDIIDREEFMAETDWVPRRV